MRTKHFENCSAPICQESSTDDTIWYQGEEICSKRPLSWIQKKQINMMNLVKLGKKRLSKTPIKCLTLAQGGK